jgi:hypothetical protein
LLKLYVRQSIIKFNSLINPILSAKKRTLKLVDFLYQLRKKSENFLQQIRLEIEFHFNFPSVLQAIEENAKKLGKLKAENLRLYDNETKGPNRQLERLEFRIPGERQQIELIKKAAEHYVCFSFEIFTCRNSILLTFESQPVDLGFPKPDRLSSPNRGYIFRIIMHFDFPVEKLGSQEI